MRLCYERLVNIDTGEVEYFDYVVDDGVPIEIINDYLNEEKEESNE